jgi:hypothetical protein
VTLTVPLNINLASLNATELTVLKNSLLDAAAEAGGFDPALVEMIVLKQDGKVVSRRRRANAPITAEVIFKDNAVIDLGAATASLNEAIATGAVSVTLVIGGQTFTATVTELATAIAAVTTPFSTMTRGGSQRHTYVNPRVFFTVILILYLLAAVTA